MTMVILELFWEIFARCMRIKCTFNKECNWLFPKIEVSILFNEFFILKTFCMSLSVKIKRKENTIILLVLFAVRETIKIL